MLIHNLLKLLKLTKVFTLLAKMFREVNLKLKAKESESQNWKGRNLLEKFLLISN